MTPYQQLLVCALAVLIIAGSTLVGIGAFLKNQAANEISQSASDINIFVYSNESTTSQACYISGGVLLGLVVIPFALLVLDFKTK
tara:strand:- start:187 stop:441 length:255 start_codon:yes stop_codon:yes gene_type:complete